MRPFFFWYAPTQELFSMTQFHVLVKMIANFEWFVGLGAGERTLNWKKLNWIEWNWNELKWIGSLLPFAVCCAAGYQMDTRLPSFMLLSWEALALSITR